MFTHSKPAPVVTATLLQSSFLPLVASFQAVSSSVKLLKFLVTWPAAFFLFFSQFLHLLMCLLACNASPAWHSSPQTHLKTVDDKNGVREATSAVPRPVH